MSKSEEKLAGVDQALESLGKSDTEISDVRARFASSGPVDLAALDSELGALSEGVSIETPVAPVPPVHAEAASEAPVSEAVDWEQDETDIEVMDESDFVLLVDENELDELEKVGEEDAIHAASTAIPPAEGEDGDGFFKKLFGNRRSRPPQHE